MMPSPAARVASHLEHLPPDGSRALDAALDRARARARTAGRPVWVRVEFEVGPEGVDAVECPERYERGRPSSCGGAT